MTKLVFLLYLQLDITIKIVFLVNIRMLAALRHYAHTRSRTEASLKAFSAWIMLFAHRNKVLPLFSHLLLSFTSPSLGISIYLHKQFYVLRRYNYIFFSSFVLNDVVLLLCAFFLIQFRPQLRNIFSRKLAADITTASATVESGALLRYVPNCH